MSIRALLSVIIVVFIGGQTMAETLTEEEALLRVAKQYNSVFAELYIKDPLGPEPIRLPQIPAEDFVLRSKDPAYFIVVHDPLTGPVITARVGVTSGLVEFDPIALAVE